MALVRLARKGVIALSSLLRSPYAPYVLLGLLLRVALMPFTVHLDMLLMFWQAAETVSLGHFDIYEHAYRLHGNAIFEPLIWSPYGPVFYVVSGGWLALLRGLGLHPVFPWPWFEELLLMPRGVFLFKLLYLLVEAGLVWLLCRVNEEEQPDGRAAALWMLHPNALYTPFMMGQNDLLPLACVVLSLWAGARALRGGPRATHWGDLAAAALGLGGAFKLFPLACLPVLCLLLGRTLGARVRLFAVGMLPFLLLIGPYIPSRAFRYSSLFNPEATGVLGYWLIWPNGYGVSVAVVAYAALLLALWLFVEAPRLQVLVACYFAALVSLSLFGLLMPQWFIWTVPFVVLLAVKIPRIWPLVALQTLFFALWAASGLRVSDLGVGLWAYALSPWFDQVPTLQTLLERVYPFERIMSAAYALYLCALAFVGLLVWRQVRGAGQQSAVEEHWRGAQLFLPLLVLFAVLGGHLFLGQGRLLAAESATTGAAVHLIAGNRLEQRFTAPSSALSCVELRLREVGAYNMTPLRLTLFAEGDSRPLATAEATPKGPGEVWQPFCFPPLALEPGGRYRFVATTEDTQIGFVVVASAEGSDSYAEGGLALNGEADPGGADLNFRLLVAMPWAEVGRDLGRRIEEDLSFFVVYGLLFNGLAFCLGLALAHRARLAWGTGAQQPIHEGP